MLWRPYERAYGVRATTSSWDARKTLKTAFRKTVTAVVGAVLCVYTNTEPDETGDAHANG